MPGFPTPSGERNTLVRIEKQSLVSDGHGGSTVVWSLRGVVYAKPEPLSASEDIRAAQLTAVSMTAWTIIWRADISAKDRLLVPPSRVLQIINYADPDGTHDELRLTCTEVLA